MQDKPARKSGDYSGRVYKPRTCPDCGTVFTPRSANHARCPDCQHRNRLALRAEREGRNDRPVCSIDGCDEKLRLSNKKGRCEKHRYTVDRAVCSADGCEEPLRKDNRTGYCTAHKSATARTPARTCAADDCDRPLRADNQSGYCPAHAEQAAAVRAYRDRYYVRLRLESEWRRQQRPVCSVAGCTNRLRSDNSTGRCTEHLYIPIGWGVCAVDGCDERIKPDNPLGRCMEHRGTYWADDAPKCGEPGCGKTLYRDNQTGFCHKHRKAWRDAYNRDYYQRTIAERREYARQYREVYADEHRAASRAWAAANPEARQAMRARRRGRLRVDMDDIDRLLSALYRQAIKGDPCFYCGSPVTDHVDHYFPLAKGGTDHWWNLCRACRACNLRKQVLCGTAFLLLTGG